VAFEIPKVSYSGKIKEVTLGKGPKAVTVGGETSYPFHLFEGAMPIRPGLPWRSMMSPRRTGLRQPWSRSRTSFTTRQHGPKSVWKVMGQR